MRWLLFVLLVFGVSAQELADQIRSAQAAGNYGEAARLYRQLISAGSDSPEIRSNYGVMLHLAGQNREAMDQFGVALRGKPDLTSANLFAGLAELDLGEPKLALSYLKRARDADGRQPAPFLGLGQAYAALRQFASAHENYARAAALDEHLAEAWYGLGVIDRSLAEELLNRGARRGGNSPGEQEQIRNLLEDAQKALTRALALDPGSARAHLVLGESLADAGKLTEATAEYQRALQIDGRLEAASLGLATQYWKQRHFDQATPLLEQFLLKHPRDPEANGMMADIEQHAGKNAEAKRHAEIALFGNPELIQTRVVLARVYVAMQQPKPAIAEITKVIAADPDGSYHFLLYRAYRMAGNEESAKHALAEFERFRQIHSEP